METIITKLEEIEELIKADIIPPAKIKMSQPEGRPRGPGVPRSTIPGTSTGAGIKPPSKKNPVKIAEQLNNPDMKDIQIKQAKEGLAFNSRGQWGLKKADEPHYHIEVNGHRVTDKPLSLSHINYYHQGVKAIESMPGHRVIPAEPAND